MINDIEQIKQKIRSLVDDFKANYKYHKEHSEANTETQLVEPLFETLGWESKDFVKQEKARRGDKLGKVDYAFKLNDKIVFFLEVKKVGISLDKEADKQVISYALSKRIPFAVSTNFEELKIFCVESEDKSTFRVLKSDNFENNINDLLLLSKEYFLNGLTLKKAEDEGRLKRRISIDKPLLEDLMHIRSIIAADIEKNYPSKYDINERDEIIQRIIGRLIFIRKCEDNGINPENLTLEEIKHLSDDKAYSKLKSIFSKYNEIYNSGLFTIGLDNDCDKITISGLIIKNLVNYLYSSRDGRYVYNFDWIDADVLGQVYEQYLGKILAQTKSGKAKLKEGQKHRKEQGIYYTPIYIVDYIVNETVGKLLEQKNIDPKKISVLDPACGSGSFLIKAYDKIYEYLKNKDDSGQKRMDSQGMYSIKTEILKNNIFGVDLDNKAVEIAKLNLLLKAAEQNRKLPKELDLHIKQGNSLIDDENVAGLSALNWNSTFGAIMDNGKFDVIIGNPPYGAELKENERIFMEKRFPVSKGNKNTALIFIEKSLELLGNDGYFGMIVPKSLAFSQLWRPGRRLIKDNLVKIVDVSKAFEDVLLEQVIIILNKNKKSKTYTVDDISTSKSIDINKNYISSTDSIVLHGEKEDFKIFEKINDDSIFLSDITQTSRGLPFQKYLTKDKTRYPVIRGKNISRYNFVLSGEYLPDDIAKCNKNKIKFLMQPKILSQRIVAHITKPKDHILIMSTLDKDGILTVDTVENTIMTNRDYSLEFVLCLLNSKLASWYSYRYIFSKAIRTMDLDNYYVGKIPIPKSFKDGMEFKPLANELIDKQKQLVDLSGKNVSESHKLKEKIAEILKIIDNKIYRIYGLTKDQIDTIENNQSR